MEHYKRLPRAFRLGREKDSRGRILKKSQGQSLLIALCLVLCCATATRAAQAEGKARLQSLLWPAEELAEKPDDHARPHTKDEPGPSARPPLPARTDAGNIRRVELPKGTKAVALTFDLCELAPRASGYDAKIFAILREKKIPATLFFGGKWMRSHRERTLQLMADPLFEPAGHAWSHGNFGIMSEEAMRDQVFRMQGQYEELRAELSARAGARGLNAEELVPPALALFRLPYGRCSPGALRLLAEWGLRVIQWDVSGEGGGDNSAPGLAEKVAENVRPGSIVLFHANEVPKGSAVLLGRLIPLLERRGFSFVTVGELLGMGTVRLHGECWSEKPGDVLRYDSMFGRDGTGRR